MTDPIGHNRPLKAYVDRLVSLTEEKKRISDDIRELKLEAKGNEIDPTALAALVKLQMESNEKREKRVAMMELINSYMEALGMLE